MQLCFNHLPPSLNHKKTIRTIMKYIVLDTNIYMHYKDAEQIDWKAVVTNGEDFEIIVPQKVIEEIDNHKDSSRGKIQKKAKAISAKFGNYFLGIGSVPTVVFTNIATPLNGEFDRFNLNINKADDVIIASALCMGVDVNNIIIVSGDNGILMTAKRLSIPFYKIADSLRLSDELSEEDKELQKVKKELEEYKNRLPKPKLTFVNGSDRVTLQRVIPQDHTLEIERLVEDEIAKYPYKTYDELPNPYDNPLMLFNSIQYTSEDIDIYNEAVKVYLKEYKTYITNKFAVEDARKRTHELRFLYDNFEGKAPTGGGKVCVRINDNVQIFQEVKGCDTNQPMSPKLTDKFTRMLKDIPAIGTLPYNYSPNSRTIVVDFGKSTQDNVFAMDVDSIMQYDKAELKLNRIYIDLRTCGSFSIDWVIIDKELPNPTKGKLNIIIE